MNIRIYSYWGNGTNTNTNNILGPFYSNIRIFVLTTGLGGSARVQFTVYDKVYLYIYQI